jgi:hypothetical protein
MVEPRSGGLGERFSLVAGGPFHSVLRRLGLVGEDQLPLPRAAIGLALAAWLLPGVLAAAQSLVDGAHSGWGYFTDLTVYARFLIAIAVMVATERHADRRLEMLARQFRSARLITDDGMPAFRAALAKADRNSSSTLAEGVLAAVALVWSGLTERFVVDLAGSSWEGTVAAGEAEMSWAGGAARFVSNPLFLFLVLRWIWRFLLWAQLLFRISRLPLQLTALHPDRSAGLGFLAIYPSIFGGFLFALSCVVASSFLKDLSLVEHSPRTIWFAVGGWLAISLALFLGPLSVFARPLYFVRERALLEYGRLGNQHHLAFHRKWIDGERSGEQLLGDPDISSASDLNASVGAIEAMRILPVDRDAVLGLLAAAGVPMLAVAATQVPLMDLVKWIAGAIF